MRVVVFACLLAACGYSPTAATPGSDGPSGDDDAPSEGPPPACVKNELSCSGRQLQTCNAEGTGIASEVTCPLACDVDHCTQASNIAAAMQLACTDTATSYTAGNNAGIGTNLAMTCDGCTTVTPTRIELGTIDLAVYCVSHFEIPAGVTFNVSDGMDAALAIFVAGDATIEGAFDIDGGSPTNAAGAFLGGPDAAQNAGQGTLGGGACGGGGGQTTPPGPNNTNTGGGGGGAGASANGAAGGTGRDEEGDMAAGGVAGSNVGCSTLELIPLIGGAGGGGGGDAGCNGSNNTNCGRHGGGGGGAIQISATGMIAIGNAGLIKANGGTGGVNTDIGDNGGSGGGGGAGGSVLLEAPTLAIAGTLNVDGGDGGHTTNHVGGAGGTFLAAPGIGQNGTANDQGGSGGGGSLGRVRLNAKTGATCPSASGCTSGALRPSL